MCSIKNKFKGFEMTIMVKFIQKLLEKFESGVEKWAQVLF